MLPPALSSGLGSGLVSCSSNPGQGILGYNLAPTPFGQSNPATPVTPPGFYFNPVNQQNLPITPIYNTVVAQGVSSGPAYLATAANTPNLAASTALLQSVAGSAPIGPVMTNSTGGVSAAVAQSQAVNSNNGVFAAAGVTTQLQFNALSPTAQAAAEAAYLTSYTNG